LKVIEQSRSQVVPELSIIAVFKAFPNTNIDVMLDSIRKLAIKHEVILITENIEKGAAVKQYLTKLLDFNSNLLSSKMVLMDLETDKGPALIRNVGAVLADSASLLFIDDDAAIWDDITPLLEYLKNNICQGVQPLIVRLSNTETVDSAGDFVKKGRSGLYSAYSKGYGKSLKSIRNDLHIEEVPSMRSAFMMVRKDAFMAVDGFDSTFNFNFEDVDLGWRMVIAGYRLLFVPSIRALHKGGRTANKQTLNEKIVRLSMLNTHAILLKASKYLYWPYILTKFQVTLLKYEFLRIKKQKVDLGCAARDFITMNQLFIERLKQVVLHRQILSEEFHFKGRKKLDDMAKGKRFIYLEPQK